jgi:DNA-binding CsgD family transcriptional regulator
VAPLRVRAADLLMISGFAHDVRRNLAAASALLWATGSADEIESLRALHWLAGVMDSAEDEEPGDLTAAPPGSPIGLARAGVTAFALSVRGFDIERARTLARAALSSGGAQRLISPRLLACEALLSADHADEAIRGLDGVLADARRWGARPIGPLLLARARGLLHAGRLDAAERDLAQVRLQGIWNGQYPDLELLFLTLQGAVLLERGELTTAGQVLGAALPPDAQDGRAWGGFLLVRAQVRLAADEAEAAYADAAECGRWLLAQQAGNPVLLPWRSVAALAKAACGDLVAASRLVTAELDTARTWGAASGVGQALLTAGLLAGGTQGVRLLTEAVNTLREAPTSLRYGWSLAELAAARISAGEPAAESLLRLAAEVAEECGAARLSRRVAEISKNSDIKDDRMVVARITSLTRAEERVAVLASSGMSNRAIATELSVTLRTVELHLTKVYRKLHIRSRAALASTLGEVDRRPEHDAD